jgi:hypothetical protein
MTTKAKLFAELDRLGVDYQKSWKKERLEALLQKAKRPDRTRDAVRQKGV